MERLVGKVLNVMDGETIEVEIAPLNPRLEYRTDGWSGHATERRQLPDIATVRLAHRPALNPNTLEDDLARIALHRQLFWKQVELHVVAREIDRLICDVRAVG